MTKKLQDDSEGIYTTGLIKRYTTLPPHLEQCTLADYAAWYDSSEQYVKQSIQTDTDNLPLETGNNDENDDDSEINNNLSHEQNLNCKKLKKRSKARIIRSVWFNKEKDPKSTSVNKSCFLHPGETRILIYLAIFLLMRTTFQQ